MTLYATEDTAAFLAMHGDFLSSKFDYSGITFQLRWNQASSRTDQNFSAIMGEPCAEV